MDVVEEILRTIDLTHKHSADDITGLIDYFELKSDSLGKKYVWCKYPLGALSVFSSASGSITVPDEGGGGGGSNYDRLDKWSDYPTVVGASGVLSAALGVELHNSISSINTLLVDYAQKTWVEAKGYITSAALADYATQAWVEGKGYLTSAALAAYATQAWVQQQGYLTSAALAAYATQAWVEGKGYLTSAALSGYARYDDNIKADTTSSRNIGYGYAGGGWKHAGPALSFGSGGYLFQLQSAMSSAVPILYARNIVNGTAQPWYKLWHDGNLSRLSQLTDDLVAGRYLLLTGGTLAGALTVTGQATLSSLRLGAVLSSAIFIRGAVGSLEWTNANTNDLLTRGAIAYWNGAYTGTVSNLRYCWKGEIAAMTDTVAGAENADKLDGYPRSNLYAGVLGWTEATEGLHATIDLSDPSFDQNTYYPVVGTVLPATGYTIVSVNVQLGSLSKPTWSTHNNGFTFNLTAYVKSDMGGTTDGGWIASDYTWRWCTGTPGSMTQHRSSLPVLWLRGGGKYPVWTSNPVTWSVKTSSYTFADETVAPTATLPGLFAGTTSQHQATIIADLRGKASSASELATTRYLWGQPFTGAADVSGDMSGVGNITPQATGGCNLGSAALRWGSIYGGSADLSGELSVGGLASLKGGVSISGDALLNGNLAAVSATLSGSLAVTALASLLGGVRVKDTITLTDATGAKSATLRLNASGDIELTPAAGRMVRVNGDVLAVGSIACTD